MLIGWVVPCLRDRNIIYKGCLKHLVRVRDMDFETLTLESVTIINEFPKVFLDDIPGNTLDREINFSIDLI